MFQSKLTGFKIVVELEAQCCLVNKVYNADCGNLISSPVIYEAWMPLIPGNGRKGKLLKMQ